VQLDRQRRLRSSEWALLLTLPAYSHSRHTHTPLVLTRLVGVRCSCGILHAWRTLHRVCTHTLCVVLSSSHMHCVGSLFPRYPSHQASSLSRPYSDALRDLVVFLTPVVVSSLVNFLMPSVASPLTSSSCPGWYHCCCLPHARRGVHGVLPFRSPRL